MALDTAEKRKSAAWLVTGLGASTVTPNASKDQEWRQQAAWGYSGIAAAFLVFVVPAARRTVTVRDEDRFIDVALEARTMKIL